MNGQTRNDLVLEDGVYISDLCRSTFKHFEETYLALRSKEKRVLNLEQIKDLPFPKKDHPDFGLWKIRRHNIFRVLHYLRHSKPTCKILDIGCGNGFFTNMMAQQGHVVSGVDVNITELKQAAAAFPDSTVHWLALDILRETPPSRPYDCITFCTSFQYFKDAELLLNRCQQLLKPGGEIHIIDSPFYAPGQLEQARENSRKHFSENGLEQMNQFYHHHTLDVFKPYHFRYGYRSKSIFKKLLRLKDSPFPWIILQV